MSQKRRRPEGQHDKDEENGIAESTASPMDRFKSLTKSLLRVSREQLQEEQRRYEEDKASSPRQKR
jgi:hypothetical protein